MGLCRHFTHSLNDGFSLNKRLGFTSVLRTNLVVTVFIGQFAGFAEVFDRLTSIARILCRKCSDEWNHIIGQYATPKQILLPGLVDFDNSSLGISIGVDFVDRSQFSIAKRFRCAPAEDLLELRRIIW
ncbi:hypothetical protein SAMN05216218_1284 [Halorientalis regularis]|uniref:Uncharacterized protein n=1 Tax=Halorientalis regularis TaxID=660518 RepID=A0A1G7TPS5_9EURY|nr:hypothetical protein SAMN05216218_1284 [Halorientalis regularis]